jgi:hypothetical protein
VLEPTSKNCQHAQKKEGSRKKKLIAQGEIRALARQPRPSVRLFLCFCNYREWARRMDVQHTRFLKLALHLEVLNLPILMEIGDFTFFQILFSLNLE